MRIPADKSYGGLSVKRGAQRMEEALKRLRPDISSVSSAANDSCQVVRTSEQQKDGNYTLRIAVVPIGGSGLRPTDYVMALESEGGTTHLGHFARHNLTATIPNVPEGQYRALLFHRVALDSEPVDETIPPGGEVEGHVACRTAPPGHYEASLSIPPRGMSSDSSLADTERDGILMKSMSDEHASGEQDAHESADLRVSMKHDEDANSLTIELVTDCERLIGQRAFLEIRAGERQTKAFVLPEPLTEDYWAGGVHGIEHVVEDLPTGEELRVRIYPVQRVVDDADNDT